MISLLVWGCPRLKTGRKVEFVNAAHCGKLPMERKASFKEPLHLRQPTLAYPDPPWSNFGLTLQGIGRYIVVTITKLAPLGRGSGALPIKWELRKGTWECNIESYVHTCT